MPRQIHCIFWYMMMCCFAYSSITTACCPKRSTGPGLGRGYNADVRISTNVQMFERVKCIFKAKIWKMAVPHIPDPNRPKSQGPDANRSTGIFNPRTNIRILHTQTSVRCIWQIAHLTKCAAHLIKSVHLTNLHTCAAFRRGKV